MRHIEGQARARQIERLSAHVSRNAQPFFQRFAFVLEAEQTVVVSGVALLNGRMTRQLIGDDGERLV
jgi:putative acetyltransferase